MDRKLSDAENSIEIEEGTHSGNRKVTEKLGWWSLYKRDLIRYRILRKGETLLTIFLTEQGLWAIFQFRVAAGIYQSKLPYKIKRPILLGMGIWQKLIEIITGICLPYRTKIGPGLYIGHYGITRVNPEAVIGENCTLSPNISIGISGRNYKRGVPVLGDRVYVSANAVILGKIKVGNDALIGPNSTVLNDVPEHSTVLGVPAVVINNYGSAKYIVLE